MKASLRSLFFILALSFFASSAALALPKVLLCAADVQSYEDDVKTKLVATGQFASVDEYNIQTNGAPSLSLLQGYNVVMVWGNYGITSGTGTVLASYVDGGGAVVLANFATSVTPVDASFNNSTYQVIVPASEITGSTTLGTVAMPSHPIMNNITSISSGTSGWRATSSTINGSAYIIAKWADGNILVAAREGVGAKSVRRVDLGMFPPSADAIGGGWVTSTQGALLMANAITWAAGGNKPPSELNLQPRAVNFGTTPPGSPITYCVTANSIGAANLHITSYGISGANASDFSIVSAGKLAGDSILIGGNTQYCIQFQPTASGNRSATFTFVTDGRDSGTQTVTLTGNGQVPSVSYSSNSMFRGTAVLLTDTSAVQYLYVNSTGVGPLTIKNVSFYGLNQQDYFITHQPQAAIPPGGVDSIGVRFAPDIEGLPDAHMVVQSNAFNIPSDTVGLYGIGELPHLSLTPVSPSAQVSNLNHTLVVNFDSVKLGTDSCMQVQLSNPGSDTLAIEKNYLSSKDFDFTLTPLTGAGDTLIPPGGSELMQVCFQPLQRGYRTATVVLKTNIPHTIPQNRTQTQQDTSSFAIQFIGTGVPSGALLITGPSTTDTELIGKQGCVTDTLWNTGGADLTVTALTTSGANAADFNGTYGTFPITIPANSFKTISVCGTPIDTGIANALLTGTGTSGNSGVTATLPLQVYGTRSSDTVFVLTPFGNTCVGSTDTATVVVVTTGNIPSTYTANTASGTNPSDFVVLAPTSSPLEQGGDTASFQVVFTPTTNTNESTNFNVVGGPGGTVPLNATGGAATIAGSGTAPATAIGATSAQFPVTVNNTGTCDWTPGTPTSSDPEFTYVSGGTTSIAPGSNGTLMYTFTPTAGGAYSSTLSFPAQTGVSMPAATVTINGSLDLGVPEVVAMSGFSLGQSHPNPIGVGSEGAVEITVPSPAEIHLAIIDVKGEVVQTVLDRHFDAGTYSVTLDAAKLSSGTYYYQMTSPGGVVLTRQMTVVK